MDMMKCVAQRSKRKYIDADVMINELRELRTKYLIRSVFGEDMRDNAVTAGTLEAVAQILDGLPAADVAEVKHGRWRKERVSSTGYGSYGVYQCSICGALFPDIGYGYNYCPNCGSRMDLDGDTE